MSLSRSRGGPGVRYCIAAALWSAHALRALSRLPTFTRSRIPARLRARFAGGPRPGLLCAKSRDTTPHPRPLTRSLTDKHAKMTQNALFWRVYPSVNLIGVEGAELVRGTSDKAVRVWRRSRHSEMRLGRAKRGATMGEAHAPVRQIWRGGTRALPRSNSGPSAPTLGAFTDG